MSMKFSGVLIAGAVALVGLSGFGTTAKAANVLVSSDVVASCTVTGGALAFGNYVNGQATNKDASSDVIYNCAPGLNITLTLDGGGANDEVNRLMSDGAGSFLAYKLFQDAARSVNWGAGANGKTIASTPGGAQTETIFGVSPRIRQLAPIRAIPIR